MYELPETDYTLGDLIQTICDEIEEELVLQGIERKKMTENEIKVGHALLTILSDWEEIFELGSFPIAQHQRGGQREAATS